MKKIILAIFIAAMALNTANVFADVSSKKEAVFTTTVLSTQKKLSKSEVKILVNRLKEIRKLTKQDLTADQRHQLRTEVLGIKEKLKNQDGGVTIYLSVGAIIIILLLIILL